MPAKKNSPKKAMEIFNKMIAGAVVKPAKKSKRDSGMWIDAPWPIALTDDLLSIYGFEKIKRATYLQDGIKIIKTGRKNFYHLDDNGDKHLVATVQEMKKIFVAAGKAVPESIDL